MTTNRVVEEALRREIDRLRGLCYRTYSSADLKRYHEEINALEDAARRAAPPSSENPE